MGERQLARTRRSVMSQSEMVSMVERIEKHQKALKLSDNQFVASYQRHLGSGRTWDRLRAKSFAEFGAAFPKWEGKLKAFVAELDGGSSLDEWFKELPITRY